MPYWRTKGFGFNVLSFVLNTATTDGVRKRQNVMCVHGQNAQRKVRPLLLFFPKTRHFEMLISTFLFSFFKLYKPVCQNFPLAGYLCTMVSTPG